MRLNLHYQLLILNILVLCFFNIYQKPQFKKVLVLAKNISNFHNPQNINIFTKNLLDVINYENIKRNLIMIKK